MILLRIDLTVYLAVLFVVCPRSLCCVYEYMLSDLDQCGYLSRSVCLAIITELNVRSASFLLLKNIHYRLHWGTEPYVALHFVYLPLS